MRGAPGQGKTHFFARLMDMAFERNWVVTYIQISAKDEGCELHRFDQVYAAIVANALARELVRNTDAIEPGHVSGWMWILEDWCRAMRRLAGGARGEVSSFRLRDTIEQTMTGLQRKYNLNGSFAQALRQYAHARADNDEETTALLRDWFHGVDVHSRGADVKRRLKAWGVLEPVSRKNAKEMLRSLSSFLAYRNYGGFLLLVDEIENVLAQPPSSRKNAYTILRELIDNLDDRHGMRRTAFYIAATPDFFDGPTGITEHEALASRVLPPSPGLPPNPAGSVVDLSAFPFAKTELAAIAEKITGIYEIAKGEPYTQGMKDLLGARFDQLLSAQDYLSIRQWVKSVIAVLDDVRAASTQS